MSALEDARTALARYEREIVLKTYAGDRVREALDALIAEHERLTAPPTGDERHAGYLQLHDLVRDAPEGVRRAVGNDKQRVLANGSFALHPSMLLRLLTRAYEQGRRQGPITDAQRKRFRGIIREARRIQAPEYPNASTDDEVIDALEAARDAS